MKYLVLAFAVLLTACEPEMPPADVGNGVSDNLRYYGFKHKRMKLDDGREIECLIRDGYGTYTMDCNWNYKGKQDETRR